MILIFDEVSLSVVFHSQQVHPQTEQFSCYFPMLFIIIVCGTVKCVEILK
eukprot:TRINITY_DN33002_c0_g1_i1.p2 TRINITY_DN33002_c0_g1~~TRINITY_DN33002_c0_g1_i1.p2  ORF type:complete len:50 (+),score=5.44 TRINITY_DN33002_c0_g1_i1:96-245(+)